MTITNDTKNINENNRNPIDVILKLKDMEQVILLS